MEATVKPGPSEHEGVENVPPPRCKRTVAAGDFVYRSDGESTPVSPLLFRW